MLKTTKSISLSGQSIISNNQVANFSANINSESGSSNINSSTINQDLYDTNKKEVRQDLADFTAAVYEVEDQLDAETQKTNHQAESNGETPA
ncbi:hypothetical protein [Loigolactobacillus coryniformis]|uniref:hypothetical protein n=1 Tax=Loigolactobacillus coryniformis TaxID=1610 RepID=UPI001C5F9C79|nr:hypothetical protein [Loigolactobacillus coryniformis]MBW4802868.1 hypothetical protein [Loigolactobacillus coryniformis subsp. torquens]MBW4805558.1 hypothetical protein [Loigolactobacillus coryniformis subsp. torquens]MCL5458098.1 hypothetical protein [Loigolactobacillus coryniformis]